MRRYVKPEAAIELPSNSIIFMRQFDFPWNNIIHYLYIRVSYAIN